MAFFVSLLKKFGALLGKRIPNAGRYWEREGGAALHHYWLYATPVHMTLSRDSYFLTDVDLALTALELQTLVVALNDHFNEQDYTFHLSHDQLFVGLDDDPNITTTPIDVVVNQDVAAFLPKGEGALAWAKVQNEIQMLLFNHPINIVRTEQGKPELNSIWFYGEGQPKVVPISR